MAEDLNSENEELDEYDLMLVLERLESLREELEEVGFSSLQEVEAALAITGPGSNGSSNPAELQQKRTQLKEIRDEMLDLDIDNLKDLNDQIRLMHGQLDQMDDDSE